MRLPPNKTDKTGNSDSIGNLTERIASDREDAFHEFYELYYKKVYRFTSYFIKSQDLCQEVVSDVFVGIWQSRKKLPDVKNIEAYLFTSAKNRAFYHLQKNKKYNQTALDEIPVAFLTDNDTPENIAIHEEFVVAINQSINQLPDRCKLIFLMAKEEGLTYHDIANILSISEKTVNAQMVTALKKLTVSIKEWFSVFA